MLVAGWMLILAALALLPSGASEASFVLVAIGVEILGLVFIFRSHLVAVRDRK